MTELHHPDRLREIAAVLRQPAETSRRLVPVLQWIVCADTGRPLGRWILDEAINDSR
jgi:hypothetical protein